MLVSTFSCETERAPSPDAASEHGTRGETATTSKEGSRRANYPILTQGGSDNK